MDYGGNRDAERLSPVQKRRAKLWDVLEESPQLTMTAIGAKVGVTVNTVSRWKGRREQGWTRDDFIAGKGRITGWNKRLSGEERGQLWDALEKFPQLSHEKIADRLGFLSHNTVSQWKGRREQGWTRDDFVVGKKRGLGWRNLSAEDRGQLWDALAEYPNVTMTAIGARFGLNPAEVPRYKTKREQGWTRDDFISGRIGARRLNDEERGQLWDALAEYPDVTLNAIADRFRVANQTVSDWKAKREQGWTRDDFVRGATGGLTGERRGQMWDALAEYPDVTQTAIGARFGVGLKTVSRWKVRREQGWTRDDFVAGGRDGGWKILNAEEREKLWDALEDYDRALEEHERRKAMAEEPTTDVTLYPIRVTLTEIAERFGVVQVTISYWKKKREQGWTRDEFVIGKRN